MNEVNQEQVSVDEDLLPIKLSFLSVLKLMLRLFMASFLLMAYSRPYQGDSLIDTMLIKVLFVNF